MTVKAKVALPPARALKEVAAVLAKRGTTATRRDDAVTVEALDGDQSHLKRARERYRPAQPSKSRHHRDA